MMRDDERRKHKHSKGFSRFALVRKTPQIGLGNRSSECAEELFDEADALIQAWRRLDEMINQAEHGDGTGRVRRGRHASGHPPFNEPPSRVERASSLQVASQRSTMTVKPTFRARGST
jgi:hypothetical protein